MSPRASDAVNSKGQSSCMSFSRDRISRASVKQGIPGEQQTDTALVSGSGRRQQVQNKIRLAFWVPVSRDLQVNNPVSVRQHCESSSCSCRRRLCHGASPPECVDASAVQGPCGCSLKARTMQTSSCQGQVPRAGPEHLLMCDCS